MGQIRRRPNQIIFNEESNPFAVTQNSQGFDFRSDTRPIHQSNQNAFKEQGQSVGKPIAQSSGRINFSNDIRPLYLNSNDSSFGGSIRQNSNCNSSIPQNSNRNGFQCQAESETAPTSSQNVKSTETTITRNLFGTSVRRFSIAKFWSMGVRKNFSRGRRGKDLQIQWLSKYQTGLVFRQLVEFGIQHCISPNCLKNRTH